MKHKHIFKLVPIFVYGQGQALNHSKKKHNFIYTAYIVIIEVDNEHFSFVVNFLYIWPPKMVGFSTALKC